MATVTNNGGSAYAADVIAVIGSNGLFSTDFHVQFSLPSFKRSSLEGLYIEPKDKLEITISESIESADRSFDPESPSKKSMEEERLKLLSLGPEWVDIYCNNVLCKDVSAVVGIKGLLFFVEDKKLSLVPSERILLAMNLDQGKNVIKCIHRNSGQTATFELWLYQSSDSLVISDIDGTITISDVRGYLETVYLGYYSYIHDGVVTFLDFLSSRYDFKLLFLTSRPITHKNETRNFLRQARDGAVSIPHGPLITNRGHTVEAAYGELIAKTAKNQKSNELLKIVDVFTAAGRDRRICPMVLGVGNRPSDALAYHSAGLAPQNILLIDQFSTIRIWEGPPPVNLPSNAVRSRINSSEFSSDYGSVVRSDSNSNSNSDRDSPIDRLEKADTFQTPIAGDDANSNIFVAKILCAGDVDSTAAMLTRTISIGNIAEPIPDPPPNTSLNFRNGRLQRQNSKFSPQYDETGELVDRQSSDMSNPPKARGIEKQSNNHVTDVIPTGGQIVSFVDDEGNTHSAIFSSYRDLGLWRYVDLLSVHQDRRYQEIQRIIHEELMMSEALENANKVNSYLKSASVNLKLMEAVHSSPQRIRHSKKAQNDLN